MSILLHDGLPSLSLSLSLSLFMGKLQALKIPMFAIRAGPHFGSSGDPKVLMKSSEL